MSLSREETCLRSHLLAPGNRSSHETPTYWVHKGCYSSLQIAVTSALMALRPCLLHCQFCYDNASLEHRLLNWMLLW